jgi:hypothetical protein
MTTAFIIIFVVLIAALVAVLAVRPRAPRVREESLGNPHPTLSEPVVRSESRHHDTPAGADLDRHSGRHDE